MLSLSLIKIFSTVKLPRLVVLLVCFLGMIFSPSLLAKTSLFIADVFKVKAVNGQSYPKNILTSNVKLNIGNNKIALQYEEVFDNRRENDLNTVKSNTFIISFYISKSGKYQLQYIKPANSKSAIKYARNPLISIKDKNSNNISLTQYFPPSQSSDTIKQQTIISKISQPPIVITSASTGKSLSDTASQNKMSTLKNNSTDQPDKDAEEMLFYWWQKANKIQKNHFMKKINKQQD